MPENLITRSLGPSSNKDMYKDYYSLHTPEKQALIAIQDMLL